MSRNHGAERLWCWFGLGRPTWLTLPRVLMHEMPDEWQDQMAALLEQWDETWNTSHLPTTMVTARSGRKFCKWPDWLLNYRHPDRQEIENVRTKRKERGDA